VGEPEVTLLDSSGAVELSEAEEGYRRGFVVVEPGRFRMNLQPDCPSLPWPEPGHQAIYSGFEGFDLTDTYFPGDVTISDEGFLSAMSQQEEITHMEVRRGRTAKLSGRTRAPAEAAWTMAWRVKL